MTTYEILGHNDQATVALPLDQLRQHLLTHQQWAGDVLAQAGRSGARVAFAKVYGVLLGSTLVSEGPGYATIRGTAGKNTRLLYRLERIDDTTTRIIPAGAVEGPAKVFIPIALLCFCIIPVVLTPLAFKMRANAMKRFSARYLEAFCRYLVETFPSGGPRPS